MLTKKDFTLNFYFLEEDDVEIPLEDPDNTELSIDDDEEDEDKDDDVESNWGKED